MGRFQTGRTVVWSLVLVLSMLTAACDNNSGSDESATNTEKDDTSIDAGDPGSTPPSEGDAAPPESDAPPADEESPPVGDGSPPEGEVLPNTITLVKSIPAELIAGAEGCIATDNSLQAVVDLFPAAVHLPVAYGQQNTDMVSVPVTFTETGVYEYQLSFDQPDTLVARLRCGSGTFMPALAEQAHTLLNIFVTDNPDAKSVTELILPDKHVLTSEDCTTCHVANEILLLSVLDYSYPDLKPCATCHDGSYQVGMTENHLDTNESCGYCHSTIDWSVSHVPTEGKSCVDCHNGTEATGKPDNHLASTDECSACHAMQGWVPIIKVDHQQVEGYCISCHGTCYFNDSAFCGENHIYTGYNCDLCHSTNTWKPALIDHANLSEECAFCHNGTDASGKASTHIHTTDVCGACHEPAPTTWVPVSPRKVNHDHVIGTCADCHRDCIVAIIDCGKPRSHSGFSDECGACHNTSSWEPVELIDHAQIATNCVSCHDNVNTQGKTSNHILSSDACEACHGIPPDSWMPLTADDVDHAHVIGVCVNCHVCVLANGYCAPVDNHVGFSEYCDACHSTDAWIPTVAIDHAHIVRFCESCHDGVSATGKPPNHMLTTDECVECHSRESWLPANFQHELAFGTCISCHDGCPAIVGGCPHYAPNHIAFEGDCVHCHNFNSWLPVDTVDHVYVLGACSDCHDGVVAQGKPDGHIDTSYECDACHTTEQWQAAL